MVIIMVIAFTNMVVIIIIITLIITIIITIIIIIIVIVMVIIMVIAITNMVVIIIIIITLIITIIITIIIIIIIIIMVIIMVIVITIMVIIIIVITLTFIIIIISWSLKLLTLLPFCKYRSWLAPKVLQRIDPFFNLPGWHKDIVALYPYGRCYVHIQIFFVSWFSLTSTKVIHTHEKDQNVMLTVTSRHRQPHFYSNLGW